LRSIIDYAHTEIEKPFIGIFFGLLIHENNESARIHSLYVREMGRGG